MFDDINKAIQYIESKRTKRTFLDFQELIQKYHFDTHLKNMIHVAGTNGKGSTTIFMRDLLMAHGFHVGTFTSPYIINHNERISVDGIAINDDDLLRIINLLYPMIEKEQLSMFEIDVCIMLTYFQELNLDYHIIECGIGGLTDKTNVIDSEVAVITNIGYDHQFMLGNTLLEIAKHKAGIIKNNVPLFTTEKNKEIVQLFHETCQRHQSPLYQVKAEIAHDYPYHLFYKNKEYVVSQPVYQINNFSLAIRVVDYLIDMNTDIIQNVIDHFYWPCRFEKIGHLYLDGAHNIDGIKALLKSIKEQDIQDIGIIFSALNDKDIDEMLNLLQGYDTMIVSFDDDRNNHEYVDFRLAIKQMQKKHQNVIVTGSLHFVSAVRKYVTSAL
ncbi:MAG: bifunctional folylpolyglutamate synthase/dihydrofolate synthase [Faecalibacillus sp.]